MNHYRDAIGRIRPTCGRLFGRRSIDVRPTVRPTCGRRNGSDYERLNAFLVRSVRSQIRRRPADALADAQADSLPTCMDLMQVIDTCKLIIIIDKLSGLAMSLVGRYLES